MLNGVRIWKGKSLHFWQDLLTLFGVQWWKLSYSIDNIKITIIESLLVIYNCMLFWIETAWERYHVSIYNVVSFSSSMKQYISRKKFWHRLFYCI